MGTPVRDLIPRRLRHFAAATYKRRRNRRTRSAEDFQALWAKGIDEELMFWRGYIHSKGSRWPEHFQIRMDPTTPLQPELVELLPDKPSVRILDVGAGPLTFLGKVWPGHEVLIEAVDVLAREYDEILDDAGVEPPIRTSECHSELLRERFAPDSFDLACAANTLDHSYDPLAAIRQMVEISPVVYLQHHPNEAETERYWGLHQWNFDVDRGRCRLWRPGEDHDLAAEFPNAIVAGIKNAAANHDDSMTFITIRRRRDP